MKELKNDYLWDGSGEADADVARMERALARFRHAGRAPEWSGIAEIAEVPRMQAGGRQWWFQFAAVAASALVVLSAWTGLRRNEETVANGIGWGVESVAGAPRVGRNTVGRAGEKATLHAGQILETDGASEASLTVADVGRVDVEPRTRLRLVESEEARTRMKLERGTIRAFIWAPPGEFMVDTPSALAVDLGCRYTLRVDDDGRGLLRTTLGWVGFKLNGREAFIPEGAVDETRPGVGPGTPFFEDADAEFRSALQEFDFGGLSGERRSAELTVVLSKARTKDALTLWHLLSRTEASDRARVFDALNKFVPAPANVTREGITRGDQGMLDAWWNELGFDDIAVWRTWERTEVQKTGKKE